MTFVSVFERAAWRGGSVHLPPAALLLKQGLRRKTVLCLMGVEQTTNSDVLQIPTRPSQNAGFEPSPVLKRFAKT